MTALSEWQNFYVIIGSSAGALIGLQFVVLALIAQMPGIRREADVGATFSTPTTVYFVSSLLLAGVMTVPWHAVASAAVVLAIGGVAGIVYAAVTTRRMRSQSGYQPEFEDWLFHSVFPLAAYAGLIASTVFMYIGQPDALFGVAATTLLLLLIGIHNAWDTVTYHVFAKRQEHEDRTGQRRG